MNRNAEESLAFLDRGFAAKMEAMFQEDRNGARKSPTRLEEAGLR